jgi:putative acetyltransferase
LSHVTVEGQAEPRGLGLAPLDELPSYQRQGFGAALVQAARERARLLGTGYVVVLGDPAYHGRFGFTPAARFGLTYRPEYPANAFMAQELVTGALTNVSGRVTYLPAFS